MSNGASNSPKPLSKPRAPTAQAEHKDPPFVTIETASIDDQGILKQLFEDGRLEGHTHVGDTGVDLNEIETNYLNTDTNSGLWVAKHKTQVVGMIGVKLISDDRAEICRLRVRNNFRRQGIGTLLMEQALKHCSTLGFLKVSLDVRIERSPAIAMFNKFGFALARTRDIDGKKLLDFYMDLYRDPSGS